MVATSSLLNIKGGVNTRGELATSVHYQVGDAIHVFVELDKNARWFLKGVGGTTVRKGDLKHVHALTMLRTVLMQAIGDEDADANAAVADGPAVAEPHCDNPSPDIDPMDAMDDVAAVGMVMADANTSPKKMRPVRILRRAVVQELQVPTRPPCAGGTGDTTAVWVYRHAHDVKRSNGKLYLRTDSIWWLLAYAADELHFQGVAPVARVSTPAGNSTAVADLRLEYDFSAKAWQGTFVAGHLAGTTKRMCVEDLDASVWQKLKAESKVDGYVSKARVLERKRAVKEFVTLWCAAVLRGEDAEFERLLTNSRGEKRGLEYTAVAVDTDCYPTAVMAVASPFLDDEDTMH
jgi:hypothetical protein